MIRAVLFDFYSVWSPDRFSFYLANAQLNGPEAYKTSCDMVESYYQGHINIDQLVEFFRVKLGHNDLNAQNFTLNEASISPQIVNFIRNLHGHFLKVGVLANLGNQEYELLKSFNDHNQLLEVIASPLTLDIKTSLMNRMVFEKTIQSIGETPDNTLYISGNPYYTAFAQSIGVNTLQFEGLNKLQHTIEQILSTEQAT